MRLAPLLSYGAVFWLASVAGAPLLASSASSAAVVAGLVVYRAASIVCHQIPERSFFLAGLPLAVCARCLGLYAGAAAASMAVMPAGPSVQKGASGGWILSRPQSGNWMLLAIAAVPTAAAWALERTGLWAGTNAVRFAAAVPLGVAAAWIVLGAIRAERADTIH